MITIIVAMDEKQLIGKKDSKSGMPWYLPEDLQHFKETTLHKTLVMGSTTFEAIGRPLPNRKTIVLSKGSFVDERVEVRDSLEAVIAEYRNKQEDLYIAGGASVYQQALDKADVMLLSRVPGSHSGETYFPSYEGYGFVLQETIPFETFTLEKYVKE